MHNFYNNVHYCTTIYNRHKWASIHDTTALRQKSQIRQCTLMSYNDVQQCTTCAHRHSNRLQVVTYSADNITTTAKRA